MLRLTINNQNNLHSIFCDLSKAFDVINHDILIIKKLEYYGFRGVILGWLKNYLSDRFQYVEIENEKSTQCPISCGVPQGSILGPLLYLIYVNDIDKSTMGNILSFADDTSLFISDTDPSNLFRTKTKFIIIKAPNQKCDCTGLSIKINGTPLIQIANNLEEKSYKISWYLHRRGHDLEISYESCLQENLESPFYY